MSQPLTRRVQTLEQFRKLLTTLSMDLAKVTDYLALLQSLGEAQQGKYWRGMSQSPAFWSTVMWGLHDAAFHGLARAYDQNLDALTMRTLMQVIEASPTFLQRPPDFEAEQLNEDIAFVDASSNKAVAHLRLCRHTFLAHRDAGKVLDGWTLEEDAPLTNDDVRSLVENGLTILNRYGLIFFQTAVSTHLHGHRDYIELLNTLQEPADAYDARLRQMLREAGEEEAAKNATSSNPASGTTGTSGTLTEGD